MDSGEETLYDDVDSGNESSGDDVDFAMEVETHNPRERQPEVDDYPFEVLSTEDIVQHMVDSIKEVNAVVEVKYLFVDKSWHSVISKYIYMYFNNYSSYCNFLVELLFTKSFFLFILTLASVFKQG